MYMKSNENKTNEPIDFALVSMPWAPVHEPSLALGILKKCLIDANYTARAFHFSSSLLRWVSAETYQLVADSWAVNEFLFTAEISGYAEPDDIQFNVLKQLCENYAKSNRSVKYDTPESLVKLFLDLRTQVIPEYLNTCVDEILLTSPSIVGFTCMFDQTMASIALAHKIKRKAPEIKIVLGGYALMGSPSTTISKAFPWIDHIVLGDGEEIIVELARECKNNIVTKFDSHQIISTTKVDLDTVPAPNYLDWFNDTEELKSKDKIEIRSRILPIEASRGCWWGEKKHCVFCGIDEDSLKYRTKSANLTLDTINQLRANYGNHYVYRFADYIMPKEYYNTLLPILSLEEDRFQFEGEIKANQTPETVKLLASAGFTAVQPGIESFSSPVLRRMDKGVRGIDNVLLLKEGHINKLVIYYNILYGFPNEEAEWYENMLSNIPIIYHLMPPISRTEVVVTRHAPLQSNPLKFGILGQKARHAPCYKTLFPKKFLEKFNFDLDSYCYYFDRNFEYADGMLEFYHALDLQIDHWKQQHRNSFIELSVNQISNYHQQIVDTRFGQRQCYDLRGAAAILHKRLNKKSKLSNLLIELQDEFCKEELCLAIDFLRKKRLLWEEDDLSLSVALPKKVTDSHRESNWKSWWMALATT